MTIRYEYRERVKQALATIDRLEPHWPTPDDLLHNRNGLPVHVQETHDDRALPFGLERVTDTPTTTKTKDGATRRLHTIRTHTQHALDKTRPRPRSYAHNVAWLRVNQSRAIDSLTDAQYVPIARNILKLADDATKQCAHGAETTPYPCPHCPGTLTRPYTHTGLLDMYVCDTCQDTWTHNQLTASAHARARLGATPHVQVTPMYASDVLGLALTTITARIRRRGIPPARTHGKRKLYWLDDLA